MHIPLLATYLHTPEFHATGAPSRQGEWACLVYFPPHPPLHFPFTA